MSEMLRDISDERMIEIVEEAKKRGVPHASKPPWGAARCVMDIGGPHD